jgi:hypothetical protein
MNAIRFFLEIEVDYLGIVGSADGKIRPQLWLVFPPEAAPLVVKIAEAMKAAHQLPEAYRWPGHVGVLFHCAPATADFAREIVPPLLVDSLAHVAPDVPFEIVTAGEQDLEEDMEEAWLAALKRSENIFDVVVAQRGGRFGKALWRTTLIDISDRHPSMFEM